MRSPCTNHSDLTMRLTCIPLILSCVLSLSGYVLMAGCTACHRDGGSADTSGSDSVARPSIETLVLGVSRQSRLYTSEFEVHKIVTHSDEPRIQGRVLGVPINIKAKPGDRKVAIPIDVTLKGYIDFSHFSARNVSRTDSTLVITLPDPRIIATATKIDNRGTRQYVDPLRSRYDDAEITAYARQGADSILSHVGRLGLVEQTRRSATARLVPLLRRMGYADEAITVRFRKQFTDAELYQLIERR